MDIDFEEIEENIKNQYNCEVISFFEYNEKQYIKALQVLDVGINYRYFEITENNKSNITEVNDKLILDELKKQNETNSDIIY